MISKGKEKTATKAKNKDALPTIAQTAAKTTATMSQTNAAPASSAS